MRFSFVFTCLKSAAQPDTKFTQKSQESLSSGIHVTVASDEEGSMPVTPETDLAASPGARAQEKVRSSLMDTPSLGTSLRFPSLPGNLDASLHLAEIQKHVSDPVLPVS